MRPETPALVFTEHTISRDVGDQHRRVYAVMWRVALGIKQAEHADKSHLMLVDRQDLEIVDQVTAGYHPAPLAFDVKSPNFLLPLEPIFTNCEQRVWKIELVGVVAAVEIDVEPVTRYEAGQRIPKRYVIGIQHRFCTQSVGRGDHWRGFGLHTRGASLLGRAVDDGRMEVVIAELGALPTAAARQGLIPVRSRMSRCGVIDRSLGGLEAYNLVDRLRRSTVIVAHPL